MLPVPVRRRDALRLLASIAAASALAACAEEEVLAPAPAPFFTPDERRAFEALADVVIPPDDLPGGAALGAASFAERLLTALDHEVPTYFAGGPFSGRTPYPAPNGAPSSEIPPNDFATFLPLDRVSLYALRLMLYGSSGVGGDPNDALLGPVIGLRDRVRSGLASATHDAGAPIETLSPEERQTVFQGLDEDFRDLLISLVAEAAFAAPEYGGNKGLLGWKLANFEGDTQPLGYSLFDETLGMYRERPEAPMSTPNPGPDPEPLDAETIDFITTITLAAGGEVFP